MKLEAPEDSDQYERELQDGRSGRMIHNPREYRVHYKCAKHEREPIDQPTPTRHSGKYTLLASRRIGTFRVGTAPRRFTDRYLDLR